jgi:Flp pilus assembly protein TadG
LVEFSLSIIVFLVMIMGIFDLGRAIFAYNGVSEAARDIARRTAVYPYDATFEDNDDLGSSSQVQATIDTQMHLVPGMVRPEIGSPDFVCVDIDGALSTNSKCSIGDYKDYVRVTVSATYEPITPLVGVFGPITITASSTASFPKTDVS